MGEAIIGEWGVGSVVALWRYPVKSMLGEELEEAEVSGRGFFGDRIYAVADAESGQIRNAKRAGWEGLFGFKAVLARGRAGGGVPPVGIVLPDGGVLMSDREDRDRVLSEIFGREVRLVSDGAGGFFDLGAVHLLTTASLERLRELYPEGDFDARRFRPNVVVDTGERGFVEEGWLGRTLRLGEEVVMEVTDPVDRCAMTTLPQGELPKDSGILSTAYRHNDNNVGVYARVLRGGCVRRGDRVTLI